jgi:hypothetical protein
MRDSPTCETPLRARLPYVRDSPICETPLHARLSYVRDSPTCEVPLRARLPCVRGSPTCKYSSKIKTMGLKREMWPASFERRKKRRKQDHWKNLQMEEEMLYNMYHTNLCVATPPPLSPLYTKILGSSLIQTSTTPPSSLNLGIGSSLIQILYYPPPLSESGYWFFH